jgi:alkanesulfonate monooxygenase SsuD/methylene tetrahydromethanopterin reductase-like flavin-dependent oxidoreductase (luciferase family)
VHFGLCVANVGTYSDPHATVALARAAEIAGWEAVFMWDHLAYVWGPPAADPWTVLAAVATETERVRLGPMVTAVARRRPHVLAQTVATLDALSGGRVTFGAGLGGSPSEFARFGEPDDAKIRAAKLDEGLEVMQQLWAGEPVEHYGPHFTVRGVRLAPRPVQAHVPVWIGGNRAPSLRRAARFDGWVADSSAPRQAKLAPDDLARAVEAIRGHRHGEPFDVAVIGDSTLGRPAEYAAAGATWWLENVHDLRGPIEAMLDLATAGPPL